MGFSTDITLLYILSEEPSFLPLDFPPLMVVSISETVSPLACAVSSEHCSPRFKAEFLFLNRLEQSWGYRRNKKKERRKGGRKEEDRKRERKKKEGRKETNLEITHSLIASAIWVIKEKKKKESHHSLQQKRTTELQFGKKKICMYVCVCVCVFPIGIRLILQNFVIIFVTL